MCQLPYFHLQVYIISEAFMHQVTPPTDEPACLKMARIANTSLCNPHSGWRHAARTARHEQRFWSDEAEPSCIETDARPHAARQLSTIAGDGGWNWNMTCDHPTPFCANE